MKKWMMRIVGISMLLGAGVAQAAVNTLFTGAGADQNFSNTNNWDTVPVTNDTVQIAANGTSSGSPAIVDPGFSTDYLGFVRIYSGGTGGTGMAYAEVASGATLTSVLIEVGNAGNAAYSGTLTLRTGGATVAKYLNSGVLNIGGDDAGELGIVTVEPGVSFSQTYLNLKPYGTLTFELGADSVSTFASTKSTAGVANTLDGLLQVDLAALENEGVYTLIDSANPDLLIAGAMKTWLDGEGGSFSGTGNDSNATFQVLNGGTMDWTLSLADGGQDLVLDVTGGGLGGESFVLFSDTFNRADSEDINLNSAANQDGPIAPLQYGVFVNNTTNVSAISTNELFLSVDGSGLIRSVPQVDLSDSSALLSEYGGFEVSYTVDSGVDYVGSVHGNYSSSLILSSDGIVQNAGAGAGNPWHGLYVTIKGNGQVLVYSQATQLLDLTVLDWGTPALTNSVAAGLGIGAHDVRLVVETDGFGTTTTNTFTLYINNLLVGSDDFNWKSANNLSLGLEAASYSARFDNLVISKIEPEQFTANGVPYSWLDSYYPSLVTDADYENAANTDTDGDGFTGQAEYLTGTDPTDPASLFGFTGTELAPAGFVITWNSVTGGLYTVSSSPDLVIPDWGAVASNIVGQVDTTSYTSTVSETKSFLKVELQ
jgi:hypothetical protein